MWTGRKHPTAVDRTPEPNEMSATRPEPEPQPEPKTMATLQLGTSVVIKGHLAASENLTIHGPFEGTIEVLAHTVTIGRHAQIKAQIVGKGVVIEGKVQGNVTATDKVEIRGTAQLRGDVVAPRIAMADGAWVCGTVETKAPDSAKRQKADSGPVTTLHGPQGQAQVPTP